MTKRTNKAGFTLVELMIVIAIIGLLAAIVIPNFIKAYEKSVTNACIANLKQIQGAAQVWAIDTGQGSDATFGAGSDSVGDYIKKWPSEYVITDGTPARTPYADFVINDDPVCPGANADHTI